MKPQSKQVFTREKLAEIARATKKCCSIYGNSHVIAVFADGSWEEGADSNSCTGRTIAPSGIERVIATLKTPMSIADVKAALATQRL